MPITKEQREASDKAYAEDLAQLDAAEPLTDEEMSQTFAKEIEDRRIRG